MKKDTVLIFFLIFLFVFPLFFQWILNERENQDIRQLARTKEGRKKLVDNVSTQLGFFYKGEVKILHIIDLKQVRKDPSMRDADEDDLVFIYLTSGIKVLYDTDNGKVKFALKENAQ